MGRTATATRSSLPAGALGPFRAAGRALVSLGLVRGSEGNLSTYDGRTLVVTRTGCRLGDLGPEDLVRGPLEGPLPDASSDLEVHRALYRARGPGAVAHAHPPGSVPEGSGGPGDHGVYVVAGSLEAAVEEVAARARAGRFEPRIRALEWRGDALSILDQRRLPGEERRLEARTPEEVAEAIAALAVRGAPLIGIAAAFGLALAASRSSAPDAAALRSELEWAAELLRASRPTAVNLGWAVDRVLRAARAAAEAEPGPAGVEAARRAVVAEAEAIAVEDRASCRAIGELGADLLPDPANVLTHCNTGALATGGWGTAQGVIVAAHLRGRRVHVWVDETRPVLQGARLTAWELGRLGVPMTLVADAAAGSLMARGLVDLVVVGADRIAANGDVANKVGTYPLAVLARRHRVPFYVAAPVSTVDLSVQTGADIPIEERDPAEVTAPLGFPVAPPGTPAANPAFDVTPARLVTAILTDRGVARPPYRPALARLVGRAR